MKTEPEHSSYDVVIVGGAMMGSAAAWFLSSDPGFAGRILVVERDPEYRFASTTHTNSCIRQQFSTALNIRISQFAVEFLRSFRERMGGDPEVPEIGLEEFGYLYLAATETAGRRLLAAQKVQASCGVATRLLRPEEIRAEWPFIETGDLLVGSHNPRNEGRFDGSTMFDWFRRMARRNGVDYVHGEVAAVGRVGGRVVAVQLRSGATVSVGTLVNAAGPRAAGVARMAGLDLPVEPRKRFTFVFRAETPLPGVLPLVIDPSGVHVRSEGAQYLAGCPPVEDGPVAPDDFAEDPDIFEARVWPALAARIPAFERIRVTNSWVGHYAWNRLDQNAVIGPHPELRNFLFMNGFSGHGLQQAPAMGRGIAELVVHGRYRTLDLSALGYARIMTETPYPEAAII